MTIATFRWADAQRVAEINRDDSVVFDICQRTKSNYGPFYWVAPLEGAPNSPKWGEPRLIARAEFAASGAKPRYIFFHCNEEWALDSPHPMKYSAALACFRMISKFCGFGEKFTLISPMTFFPTCDSQLGWRKEDRTAVGRWGSDSAMPNRYDRAARNAQLRLRNEIIEKISKGGDPLFLSSSQEKSNYAE